MDHLLKLLNSYLYNYGSPLLPKIEAFNVEEIVKYLRGHYGPNSCKVEAIKYLRREISGIEERKMVFRDNGLASHLHSIGEVIHHHRTSLLDLRMSKDIVDFIDDNQHVFGL